MIVSTRDIVNVINNIIPIFLITKITIHSSSGYKFSEIIVCISYTVSFWIDLHTIESSFLALFVRIISWKMNTNKCLVALNNLRNLRTDIFCTIQYLWITFNTSTKCFPQFDDLLRRFSWVMYWIWSNSFTR